MKAFETQTGLVVPIDRSNIDTDAILPKQFLKMIERTGFGPYLFDDWRYLDRGEPGQDCSMRPLNHDFTLNQARYQGASILLARENFGCGSSREHAPWALSDWGVRVIIAPSFAEIFYGNCFKNGLLPITLKNDDVNKLFEAVEAKPGYSLCIDLQNQCVVLPDGNAMSFDIDPFRKNCLMLGLDDVGVTLGSRDKIKAFEDERKKLEPWIFLRS
ncbi:MULTISPECIES: 3-isopropylmalate dehydratase small subunit [unclassified Pseudomonas]|uniref:3-isopropylmalate dehydratase small subunit n=1 Tax=unclassified Pseudomonas TaxID=196821 RepID=UPI0035C1AD30